MATSAEKAELGIPSKIRKIYTATLASGAVTILTGFRRIHHVNITQNATTALTEAYSFEATGGSLAIDSDNASSTAVLSIEVTGEIGS